MTERWLPVVGFEGQYEVSDLGRVRSLTREITASNGVRKIYRGKLLRPGPRKSGHLTVSLCGKTHNVHALVLETFVGPCPHPGWQARHGDGNEKNNRLDNLEWNTRARNVIDRKWHRGAGHYRFTPETAAEAKSMLRRGVPHRTIARAFGVARSTIHAISQGRFHTDV